jgi:thiamine biosynthesis lipoprotein
MNGMDTPRQPTRRDFLQGRAAAQLLAGAAIGPQGNVADTSSAATKDGLPTRWITSLRRRAMACEFEVQLAAGRHDGSTERGLKALDLVESLEDQLTICGADSEVLRINRAAARGPVSVEPRLFALFRLAERLHRETQGAFDVTSGPLSEIWGFSRRAGRLPSQAEIAAALERVGMQHVALDAANCRVAFRRPGVSLHLNCIGKGYALDRMAELLDGIGEGVGNDGGVGDYLLHGGRSSVLARGNCPGSARRGWTIGVPHPLRPGERLAEVDLVDRALGTSGSGTQFFEHSGRRYGHLLDPRTGRPAEGVYSATVVAPSAAEADALSTALYVMGAEKAGAYCAVHPELGAILVSVGDEATDVRVATFGLAPDCWRPLAAV